MTYDFNTPISDDLVNYFKKYTTEIDVAKVCEKSGVGFHTLRRLRLGSIKVSNEENGNAITELMKLAVENVKNQKENVCKDEKKMKKNLTEMLDCL